MDERAISLNMNSSTKSEVSQSELSKLHELANQTEQQLQTAINSSFQRNEKLNVLLNRSDLLLHQNQAFGIGVMDYRNEIRRNQTLNRLKFIAIGILLFVVIVLVVILNIILNHTDQLQDRNTNIILG
ncbi:unnamed protein product [Adineta ricciae]|uniref:Uncharacterized protein n=1 Tax=Adineta ricciae TaxID=249248 RepID=A0A814DCR7_ADIRI|nr:unnamed protein product [Adineta ricciae]CAF0954023.1 unnamed protein product [Adineta ricciae]